MHHVCPMVPGSGPPLGVGGGVDPVAGFDDDDGDSDVKKFSDGEFLIEAAKRARSSSSHKEGLFEAEAPPTLLPGGRTPSSLELSLMLAARAAQQQQQGHSRSAALTAALQQQQNVASALASSGGGSTTPPTSSSRSRKSRDPKRLNPSAGHSPDDGTPNAEDEEDSDATAASILPQSEPEDLSSSGSRSKSQEDAPTTTSDDARRESSASPQTRALTPPEGQVKSEQDQVADETPMEEDISPELTAAITTSTTSEVTSPAASVLTQMPIANK